MNKRSAFTFIALYFYYVCIPAIAGILSANIFVRATFFCVLVYLLYRLFFNIRSNDFFKVKGSWLFCLYVLYILSIVAVSGLILAVLFLYGDRVFSLTRSEVFEARQSLLTPITVIFVNVCIITSAILGAREDKYFLALVLPIFLDIITQSRGFILSSMLVVYCIGGVPKRYFIATVFSLLLVTIIRISGDLSIFKFVEYMLGESFNTALGNGLISESQFSVTALQAVRVVLSPFPYLGGFLGIESEAVSYNQLLEKMYGLYGLAFGVVGFVKFTPWNLLVLSIFSAFLIFSFFLWLRLPRVILLAIFITMMPSLFRWSPAEYFYLVGRVSVIFMVGFYLSFLLKKTHK